MELTQGKNFGMINRKRKILLLLFIFLFALIFRLPGAGKSFIIDEGHTFSAIQKDINGLIDYLITNDAHPPLYPLLLKGWSNISSGAAFLRLLNIFFGAITCIFIFLIGEELFSKRIAFISSFLSIISPQLVFISQYLRSYLIGKRPMQ